MNSLQKKVLREIIELVERLSLPYPSQNTGSELECELINLQRQDREDRDDAVDWLKTLLKDK